MRLPVSWLKDYVDVELSPAELAERLTFSGLEVEGIETWGADLSGLVVGEVRAVDPHPGSDSLSVCSVFDGARTLQVVCGARNAAAGDKVPLAPEGARLPGGAEIRRAIIHGVESSGMLCAEDEIGFSEDHSGVMILPRGLAAGTPLSAALGGPEPVLVLEVTPNRPDCLSVIGVAREVAALCGRCLKLPSVQFPENGPDVSGLAAVRVEDPAGCPRYTARVFSGVRLGPSPVFIRRRLLMCGVRPINNVVDITNYVMLECGQPLHAFDRALLDESRVVVRRARPGEKIATLDEAERGLSPDMLVIADASKPVAVAGVMGGRTSGINAGTGSVLLESACFAPPLVRSAARGLDMATESSHRFERGVDVMLAEWASRRAAALLAEHAGAEAARGVIDVFQAAPPERFVACRFDRVRRLLGVDIADDAICGVFEALMLSVSERNGKGCRVRVPSFRMDIEIEADLIEEVARIHGLDKIPVTASRGLVAPGADDAPFRAAVHVKAALRALGLTEILNYSFVSERLLGRFGLDRPALRIILPNPISAEHSALRPSLVPQMLSTLGLNRSRQVAEAALFETGRVFFRRGGAMAEEDRIAVGLMGPAGRPVFDKRRGFEAEEMFLWMKGILEGLASAVKAELRLESQTPAGGGTQPEASWFPVDCFEPGRCVRVTAEGREAGVIGIVSGEIAREWRILDPVGVLELRLAPLLEKVFSVASMKPLPAYPAVIRDVAMIVDSSVRNESVLEEIRKNSPKELTEVRLFDIYTGKGIGKGRKSLAYSMTYRSLERTLTDEEVNAMHESIKESLKNGLKAEIREG